MEKEIDRYKRPGGEKDMKEEHGDKDGCSAWSHFLFHKSNSSELKKSPGSHVATIIWNPYPTFGVLLYSTSAVFDR